MGRSIEKRGRVYQKITQSKSSHHNFRLKLSPKFHGYYAQFAFLW